MTEPTESVAGGIHVSQENQFYTQQEGLCEQMVLGNRPYATLSPEHLKAGFLRKIEPGRTSCLNQAAIVEIDFLKSPQDLHRRVCWCCVLRQRNVELRYRKPVLLPEFVISTVATEEVVHKSRKPPGAIPMDLFSNGDSCPPTTLTSRTSDVETARLTPFFPLRTMSIPQNYGGMCEFF
jgi:hypothetical protein